MKESSITARTPAKLILSGEHSVVYGHPALAIAINRYMQATVNWSSPLHFSFHLLGIDFRKEVTLEALKRLKYQIDKQYSHFTRGEIHIRDVLQNPFDLTLYTAINVLEKIKRKLPMGINITTQSDIPMGCGMGSSAATVVSVIYALGQLLDTNFKIEDYIHLGIDSENLQHGFSSGLDVEIVYHGGCIFYQKGLITSKKLPSIPMQLIQTGKPQSSTGECVSQAKPFFTSSNIGLDFSAVTLSLVEALADNNILEIKNAIRANHQLLKTIGVVPEKIKHFIAEIEKRNGAAKICGAGSIAGDQAGAVLVISEENITPLAKQFGYEILLIEMDEEGTKIIK